MMKAGRGAPAARFDMLSRLQALWARPWVRWPVNVLSVVLMIPLVFWLSVKALSTDEPLRDDLEAVLRHERPAEDPGNAYYALVGISATDSADAQRVGTLAVMIAFDRIENGDAAAQVTPAIPGGDALPFAPIKSVCPSGQDVCLTEMRANGALVRQWEKAHAVIWERYLDATGLPRYSDVEFGADAVASRLAILSSVARFVAVDRWSRGQQSQAIDIVDRGIALCRRVLAGTVALAVKLAAARCVANGWQLAGAIAFDAPAALFKRAAPLLRKRAAPLSPEELAFGAVVRAQVRSNLPAILELPEALALTQSGGPWLEALTRPFFLRNATLNRYFEDSMAQVALDGVADAELASRARPVIDARWWPRLRSGNPIGLALLDVVPRETLVPHMLELRALEAQRRLLLRVLQCVETGVLPKDPGSCAAAAPPELRNPFDGSAPLWDDAARAFRMPVPSAAYGVELRTPTTYLTAL